MLRHNLIDDLQNQIESVLMALELRIVTVREVPNASIFVDFLYES